MLESETFVDNPFDNRIGTVSNGVTTWTLYDGSSPIMDFSGSGALEVRYLQGPTGILARESASGAIAWYLSDRLGTVSDLIDNSGNVIDHVDYTAFGAVIDENAPGAGDRFVSFAGLVRDNITGLNLAIERAENPTIGRWTQQDPLSFAAGDADLYRYVGNGVTSGTDSTGTTDHGEKGGKLTIDPKFDPGKLKITIIPEDYEKDLPDKPAQRPLPKNGTINYPVDAVLIQGDGMYKITNGAFCTLKNDANGKPVVVINSFWPNGKWYAWGIFPWWPSSGMGIYEIGQWNPFGPHGDIPGDEGGDESKIPKSQR